jgi:hypothetical protein
MVVHSVEHTSRRGAARETETLLGFKRRRMRRGGNGRSFVETEGALREGMFSKASFPMSAVPADPHSILDRVGSQFEEKNRNSGRSRAGRKFAFRHPRSILKNLLVACILRKCLSCLEGKCANHRLAPLGAPPVFKQTKVLHFAEIVESTFNFLLFYKGVPSDILSTKFDMRGILLCILEIGIKLHMGVDGCI